MKAEIMQYLSALKPSHISNWNIVDNGKKIVVNIESKKMQHWNVIYNDELIITFTPLDKKKYRYDVTYIGGTNHVSNTRGYNYMGSFGDFITESPAEIVKHEVSEKIKWCQW